MLWVCSGTGLSTVSWLCQSAADNRPKSSRGSTLSSVPVAFHSSPGDASMTSGCFFHYSPSSSIRHHEVMYRWLIYTLLPMSCPSLPTALGDLCSICPDKVCLDWITANGIVELVTASIPNHIGNYVITNCQFYTFIFALDFNKHMKWELITSHLRCKITIGHSSCFPLLPLCILR